jgi:competence protein ComEC
MISPVVVFAVSYIAGIVIADCFHMNVATTVLSTGINLLIGLIVIAWLKLRSLATWVIVFLFFSLGLLITALHISHIESGVIGRAAADNTHVTVYGSMNTDAEFKNNSSNFDLNVSRASIGRTGWQVSERVRVRVRSEKPLALIAGQNVMVTGQLEQPESIGEFDYKRYLYHKDISAILTVSETDIKPVSNSGSPIWQKFSLIASTSHIRRWIKNAYLAHLPQDSAALLIGIVLGDDSAINEELNDSFRTTGLTHILAASGMNIALVLAALWPLLRYMRLKPSVQLAVLVVFAGLYTLVSGMQPSLTRAFLMAAVGLAAWLSGRDKNGLASISAAALFLLVLNPFTLYDIGFQLSFLATASLIVFVPMLDRMMADLPGWLRAGLSVTMAAQIGVLPVLIYYFGQVSVISVLANLLIVPLAEPALILGMILLPFQALVPILAMPFYWVLAAEMSAVIYLNKLIAATPGAALVVDEPSIIAVAVMYAVIAVFGAALHKASLKLRFRFGHIIILLIALTCASIWVTAYRSLAPSQLQVTFFDVGQGDSALLQTPDGVKVLIDTGPDFDILKRKLDLKGIEYIDAVIISHTHADHASGVSDIFRNYNVGSFYYPRSAEGEAAMSAMLASAEKTGVRSVPVDNHDHTRFGKNLEMESFCRDADNSDKYYVGNFEGGENDRCIVCLMEYGEFEVMFTGDAGKEIEHEICEDNCGKGESTGGNINGDGSDEAKNTDVDDNAIEADVLKVGHHGSATSSTEEFLKEVDPKVSVISVGEHNRYGHPTEAAIARIRASGSKIYRTDRNGDVTVISDGNAFKVNTEH